MSDVEIEVLNFGAGGNARKKWELNGHPRQVIYSSHQHIKKPL
jgi:hypothetical protein